ncbi:hypothetical protein WA026_000979 [Henosepilachna vigintioctopunctata]|uniref:M-phase phosphoprotein 6 n=1 Tax=Henosepilachna vigintioctopunctata TaxID=420089 RepID=A0AAW1V0A8_9CUCU
MEEKPNTTQNVNLTKGTLEMKFMKKSKDKVLKLLEDEESREIYSKEITEEMKRAGNIVFIETSIFNCKKMIEGRLSFGGMNPEIEKLMTKDSQRLDEIERSKEKDISDIEMAKGYSSVVETMQNKFLKKSKKKFKKPSADI